MLIYFPTGQQEYQPGHVPHLHLRSLHTLGIYFFLVKSFQVVFDFAAIVEFEITFTEFVTVDQM